MCKEDIRLGRNAAGKATASQAASAVAVKLLGQNPNRFSLSAHCMPTVAVADAFNVMLYTVAGTQVYPLMALTADHPGDRVSLADAGQIVLGEVWMIAMMGANVPNVFVAETGFNAELENIR